MPELNPYWKNRDIKLKTVLIPTDIKHLFTIAIKNLLDTINKEKTNFEEFNLIINAIKDSNGRDVEIELPESFIKYIFWKPIRDIFEKDISVEEIASLKSFFQTVYKKQPNSFVSCRK